MSSKSFSHLQLFDEDSGGVLFDAVLVGPLARAQAAFDMQLRALAQVLAGAWKLGRSVDVNLVAVLAQVGTPKFVMVIAL